MPRKKKSSGFNDTKIIQTPKRSYHWSDRELLSLTAALQRYGFSETKKIAEFIETKSEAEVKQCISVQVAKVRQDLLKKNATEEEPPINLRSWYNPDPKDVSDWPIIRKWRRIIFNQLLRCVKNQDYSKILLEDLFEAFYMEAEETNNPQLINVKAIYKYLLDCIRGAVPAELSPIDSSVVLMLLGQLREMQRDLDFDEEMQFMKTFKKAKSFAPFKVKDEFREKTKKRQRKESCSSKDDLEYIEKEDDKETIKVAEEMYVNLSKHRKLVQSFNPLNVPMWTLVKEQGYVQNKCDLAPRESYVPKTEINYPIFL